MANILTDVVGSEGIKVDFKMGFNSQDILLLALAIFGSVLLSGIILHLMFPNK